MKMGSVILRISSILKLEFSWLDMKLAFLMGRHRRLGAESCVRFLPKDILRLVLDLARESFVVFGGLVNRTGLPMPVRDVFNFQPFYDDPESTRRCSFFDGTRCARMLDMPLALSFGFGACDGNARLFVGGGTERVASGRQLTGADGPWEGRPNLDLFVLCLKTRTWSKISALLQKPCMRGASVVFGNKLIVLGGYNGNGIATPDRAFDISKEPSRVHFPQRAKLQADCWYAKSSCTVTGTFLVACCAFRTRHGCRKCRVDVLDLSDNFANWVAIPDLDMDIGVSDPAFGMFDGVLFLIGGMKGVSFGCAVDAVWAADLKGECPVVWKKGIPLPVPLFGCAVVSAKDGIYCIGGSTGHECNGFKRSRTVYRFNGKSWSVFSQLAEGLDSCGAVHIGAALWV